MPIAESYFDIEHLLRFLMVISFVYFHVFHAATLKHNIAMINHIIANGSFEHARKNVQNIME